MRHNVSLQPSCKSYFVSLQPNMKLIAYILSIYVFLLAVIPCQCKEVVYAQIQHTESVAEFHSVNNYEGGMQKFNAGLCSPFCADARVHAFTLYVANDSFQLSKFAAIVTNPQIVYYEAVLLQAYTAGVWRPPIALMFYPCSFLIKH